MKIKRLGIIYLCTSYLKGTDLFTVVVYTCNRIEQIFIYTYKFMCISITKTQKMNSYYLAEIFHSHIILKTEIQGTMDPTNCISIYNI
jgi:hypothetical protein